jgi:hypothetical protein
MSENLRELDAWIAVNVFGKKAISIHDKPPTKGTEDDYFIKEYLFISHSCPHYSTEGHHALLVLKKCAEIRQATIAGPTKYDKWFVWSFNDDANLVRGEGETLEIAICDYAKLLYSK